MRVIWLGVVIALSGCASVAEQVEDSVVAWRQTAKTIKYGKQPDATVYKSAYCYRTLADVDCYDTPQPGEEHRFSGYTAIPMTAQNIHLHAAPEAPMPMDNTVSSYAPPVVESAPLLPPSDEPRELMEVQIGDQTYSTQNLPTDQQLEAQGL